MAEPRGRLARKSRWSPTDRMVREEAIDERYRHRPGLRALRASGPIDRTAHERAERLRAAGPPPRPSRTLIAAWRAERERQVFI